MAVFQLLAGQGKESKQYFQEAVAVKSSAFGENSLEVAVSSPPPLQKNSR